MSNRNIRNLGRQFGFEDDGETPTMDASEVDETGAPIKGDETVKAEKLAVDEASDEITEEVSASDDLVEADETLESIYSVLKDAKDSGRGISHESARFMTIAIEGIRIRGMRLTTDAIGVPSLEAFGRSSRQQSNTELSMEGVGDVLRKVWEWIKTQVKKLVAKIKNWYLKVLDAAPRLKKRAEAIKKKADSVSGSTDETTIDLSVNKLLSVDGKSPKPDQGVTNSKEMVQMFNEALKGNPLTGGEVTKMIDSMGDDSNTEMFKRITLAVKTFNTIKKGTIKADRYGDGWEGSSSDIVFGEKMFVARIKGATGFAPTEMKRVASSIFIGFEPALKKPKEIDSSADYTVLSTDQVGDICDNVISVCEYIIDYKKLWADREKDGDKLSRAVDKFAARVDKDKDKSGDESRKAKDTAFAIHGIWTRGIASHTNVIGYGISTGRALLTWCERSLSTYK